MTTQTIEEMKRIETSLHQMKTQTIDNMKDIEKQNKSNAEQHALRLLTEIDGLVKYTRDTDRKLKKFNQFYEKMKALDGALEKEHESKKKLQDA